MDDIGRQAPPPQKNSTRHSKHRHQIVRGCGRSSDRVKQPSAVSRTLSRALNMTVTTVIAGQVKHIKTTVEQP